MNGQIRADSRLAELAATADAVLVLGQRIDGADQALRALQGVRGIEAARTPDGFPSFRVLGDGNADLCPKIYDLVRGQNWPLRELRRDVRTLESVFNQLATTTA